MPLHHLTGVIALVPWHQAAQKPRELVEVVASSNTGQLARLVEVSAMLWMSHLLVGY
jgi:hypothetical protein